MINKIFEEARGLYEQGRWRDFTQFCTKNLNDAHLDEWSSILLFFWQGMAHLKQNLFNEARQNFDILAQKYPHSHLADEGRISLLFAEHKYDEIIKASFLFQEKYPTFWQSYHWRGNAFMSLRRYNEALKEFTIIKAFYPDIVQGFEGVYRAKKALREKSGLYAINKELLDDLRLIATHPKANYYQRFDYIDKLLMIGLLKEAKSHLDILKDYPAYYHLAQAMLSAWHSDNQEAYKHFKKGLSLADVSNDKAKILETGYATFKRLKKYDEYLKLVDEIKESNNQTGTLLLWAEANTIKGSWRSGWEIGAHCLEEQIRTGLFELPVLIQYLTYLLRLDRFRQAELILVFAICQYKNDSQIYKLYALSAHHQKRWQQAKERFDDFFAKFGFDVELFYPYINVLYHLGEMDKIYDEYRRFMDIKFPMLNLDQNLNRLQIDLLLGKSPQTYQGDGQGKYELTKIKNLMPTIKQVVHSDSNEVLIICFDRLRDEVDAQDAYDGLLSDDILTESIGVQGLHNDFDGFAGHNTAFNYLLVRDFTVSYCLLNFDKVLAEIKRRIEVIKPKHIVCMGTSAGAFASILYGHHLGAKVVFAMMARLHAFMTPNLKPAHRKIQEHFGFTDPALISMPYLQQQSGGFVSKVYIAICENEASEAIGTYALDKSDPNLHISYFEGDIHALPEYVGVRHIYAELVAIIDKEIKNNFTLPIQRGIFSQIDGYKDSSFDRLNEGSQYE